MGSFFSSIDSQSQNPNSSSDSLNPTMTSSDPESSKTDQSTKPTEQNPEEENQDVVEEEEEGECGFCLFMKGGGCRDAFINWEDCVKEAEAEKKDVVEKCFDATAALRKCMQAHSDYYEPILRAEQAAEEEIKKELEKEAAEEEVKKELEKEKEEKDPKEKESEK
ncbi:hypothetical protein JCGZ_15642 [Jatropha curcas]|uniref:GCK domain-containing protein n=1 Tax=Jatropha curcas TaxID=180498 RepID=A0A067L9T6_JATCU|nr:DNA ligase 1 [Jatropha curcas]XP_037495890.1 DNA ligase 1 [Jatropha curcas]XP_037495891.1 DNA ligase 1 [Jatropha curcas]XP_037495892.1 DNA ligase 1 [Jatropha curcas]KDP41235.1 hypothetical protein JCGZ_15642 [Jatropha curcas]